MSHVTCFGADRHKQASPAKPGEQVQSLAAGAQHACVLTRRGRLKCWGSNAQGQAEVPAAGQQAVKAGLGCQLSCVVDLEFRVVCWGSNMFNQLEVVQLQAHKNVKVIEISLMMYTTCLLDENHRITCKDPSRIVKFDNVNNQSQMISVMDSGFCQYKTEVNEGYPFLRLDCLDLNGESLSEINNPIKSYQNDTLLSNAVRFVSLGESNSCVLLNSRTGKCWGKNRKKLNNIDPSQQGNLKYISTSQNHSCGILSKQINKYEDDDTLVILKASKTVCWGDNSKGQSDVSSVQLRHGGLGAQVGTGLEQSCVMAIDQRDETGVGAGAGAGAGSNDRADRGRDESDTDSNNGVGSVTDKVSTLNIDSKTVTLSNQHDEIVGQENKTFLKTKLPLSLPNPSPFPRLQQHPLQPTLQDHAHVYLQCWGDNSHQQLDIPPLPDLQLFAAGSAHLCALLTPEIRCWGANLAGQAEPPAPPAPLQFSKVSAGFQHNCAVNQLGTVVCWGWLAGERGQLQVPRHLRVTDVVTGQAHNCVSTQNREVKCWGRGDQKQTDVPQGLGLNVFQMFAGWQHSCVTLFDGQVKCWGRNDKGQLDYEI